MNIDGLRLYDKMEIGAHWFEKTYEFISCHPLVQLPIQKAYLDWISKQKLKLGPREKTAPERVPSTRPSCAR